MAHIWIDAHASINRCTRIYKSMAHIWIDAHASISRCTWIYKSMAHIWIDAHASINSCTCIYKSMAHIWIHAHASINRCTCIYKSMAHIWIDAHASISRCTCIYKSMAHIWIDAHSSINRWDAHDETWKRRHSLEIICAGDGDSISMFFICLETAIWSECSFGWKYCFLFRCLRTRIINCEQSVNQQKHAGLILGMSGQTSTTTLNTKTPCQSSACRAPH